MFEEKCLDLFADHPEHAHRTYLALLNVGRRQIRGRHVRRNKRVIVKAGLDAVDRAYGTFTAAEAAS